MVVVQTFIDESLLYYFQGIIVTFGKEGFNCPIIFIIIIHKLGQVRMIFVKGNIGMLYSIIVMPYCRIARD